MFDVRALRVIVTTWPRAMPRWRACTSVAAGRAGEFDDYIAKPKPNGYQSLHTVVLDDDGRPLEIQIRTRAMHEHAEHGVAAHWAYKEAGVARLRGRQRRGRRRAASRGGTQGRAAPVACLGERLQRQHDGQRRRVFDDRIYVFTPQANVVELPAGGTPVDFAYAVHTDLGHRCRGARVDGAMVPLNTPLRSGQTVEIVSAKEGGPSLDWLNGELGYLASRRERAPRCGPGSMRGQDETIARGRERWRGCCSARVERSMKLDDAGLATGLPQGRGLFEVVGKDEFSLRNIEELLRPAERSPTPHDVDLPTQGDRRAASPRGGVLVVGVDSLLTNLARCCRPAPPDAIAGFVTRGKGRGHPPCRLQQFPTHGARRTGSG